MSKLNLSHVAPYLPYAVKGRFNDCVNDVLTGIDSDRIVSSMHNGNFLLDDFKPFLRPLTDFAIEINTKGKVYQQIREVTSLNIDWTLDFDLTNPITNYLPLMSCNDILQILFKNHYDLFDLIYKGSALNIKNIANENLHSS